MIDYIEFNKVIKTVWLRYRKLDPRDPVVICGIRLSISSSSLTEFHCLYIDEIEVYHNGWVGLILSDEKCREKIVKYITDEYDDIMAKKLKVENERNAMIKDTIDNWCKSH